MLYCLDLQVFSLEFVSIDNVVGVFMHWMKVFHMDRSLFLNCRCFWHSKGLSVEEQAVYRCWLYSTEGHPHVAACMDGSNLQCISVNKLEYFLQETRWSKAVPWLLSYLCEQYITIAQPCGFMTSILLGCSFAQILCFIHVSYLYIKAWGKLWCLSIKTSE